MSERIELREFIKENYQLIATIGVFGALTALFLRIEGFELIAFIPLMIFVVLMIELLVSFPKILLPLEGTSYRLAFFYALLMLLLVGVSWYVLVEYVTVYYQIFLLSIFIGAYIYIGTMIEDRLKLFERLAKRVGRRLFFTIQFIVMFFIAGTGLIVAFYLTNWIAVLLS